MIEIGQFVDLPSNHIHSHMLVSGMLILLHADQKSLVSRDFKPCNHANDVQGFNILPPHTPVNWSWVGAYVKHYYWFFFVVTCVLQNSHIGQAYWKLHCTGVQQVAGDLQGV